MSRTRVVIALTIVAVLALMSVYAFAHLEEFTNQASNFNVIGRDRWSMNSFAVKWNLNPDLTGAKVVGTKTVQQLVSDSFATWISAPDTTLTITQGANAPTSLKSPGFDGQNVIAFSCVGSNCDFSKDISTLAVTFTTTSDILGESDGHGGNSQFIGQILDADIFFNTNATDSNKHPIYFTTDGTPCPGSSCATQDMQTVLTHEIGHFLGLDHSGVVHAMMFPFAPDLQTTIAYDDVAAVSTLYPTTPLSNPTDPCSTNGGVIRGTVTFASGGAVFGAHVFADSTTASTPWPAPVRKSPISAFTFPDGTYCILGVPPDTYEITAEPADDPIQNADIQGWPATFNKSSVQTNFNTRFH